MNCKKCNVPLNDGVKFCANCGSFVETINGSDNNGQNINNNISYNNQVHFNSVNNNGGNVTEKNNKNLGLYSLICGICSIVFSGIIGIVLGIISIVLRKNEQPKTQKGKIGKILGIIGIIISIVALLFTAFTTLVIGNFFKTSTSVKGNYSREVFSGNHFEYITSYDTATFTFNKDSTFEIKYVGGSIYKGTYEIYNGVFITVKANEIKKDTTIDHNEELADDIQKTADRMMADDMVNTYLLWLITDDNILQPFMVLYDQTTNSAVIVNIYARTQGTLILK